MKKILVLVLSLTFLHAQAQDNYGYLSWNLNVPLSNTEWLDATSSAGGKLGFRFMLRDTRFSVGVDFNWATYDQYEPTQTFEEPGGSITTDYFKYVYNYGIVVSGQYNVPLDDNERFYYYGGLGLGANSNTYSLYYNIYEESYRKTGFLVRPEAGLIARFGRRRSFGAIAAVHYDFSTNQIKEFNYTNFSNVGFQLGLVLMSR